MISVVGPAFWDVTLAVDDFPKEGDLVRGQRLGEGPGGSAANTAAWIAAHDVPVYLFTRTGLGENGKRLHGACNTLPLAMNLRVQWLPPRGDVGTCLILVSPSGERTIIWASDDVGRGELGEEDEKRLASEEFTGNRDALLASSGVAWIKASADRRAEYWRRCEGALRGIDVGHLREELAAGRRWELLVGSLAEAPLPDASALAALGCRLAVMTDGGRGCDYSYEAGPWQHLDSMSGANVLDTTGAGDAFLAGLLVGLDNGLPAGAGGLAVAEAAVKLGVSYGAEAVAQLGSWPRLR